MQAYDLSTLPTGERVISEHVPNVTLHRASALQGLEPLHRP